MPSASTTSTPSARSTASRSCMGEPPEKQARTIWLVSKYISPKKYGFETRLFAMAREFVKMGRRPVVITSDSNHLARFPEFAEPYTHENIDGVDTWWIRTSKYA